jgi:hypothetical protein
VWLCQKNTKSAAHFATVGRDSGTRSRRRCSISWFYRWIGGYRL